MLHIVLFEPEIPQNTGNIMRTAAASGCVLHIIEPTGFILDDKRMKRSVMDYQEQLIMEVHDDLEAFYKTVTGEIFYVTRYGQHVYSEANFSSVDHDIYLMFGKESTGIPKLVLRDHLDHCLRIPMAAQARSLNLANCVALVTYEALRQQGFPGLSRAEVQKGADWLEQD